MAVTAQRITVSTTAVALVSAETDVVAGSTLVLRNGDATNSVSLGPSNVTAGAGYGLAPGAVVTVELAPGEQIYAIRDAAADVVVHVLRLGV